jgi:hypothetical protein
MTKIWNDDASQVYEFKTEGRLGHGIGKWAERGLQTKTTPRTTTISARHLRGRGAGLLRIKENPKQRVTYLVVLGYDSRHLTSMGRSIVMACPTLQPIFDIMACCPGQVRKRNTRTRWQWCFETSKLWGKGIKFQNDCLLGCYDVSESRPTRLGAASALISSRPSSNNLTGYSHKFVTLHI